MSNLKLLLFFTLFGLSASAQKITGKTVSLSSGLAEDNVVVSLALDSTGAKTLRNTTSTPTGEFSFFDVPAGNYQLIFYKLGFETKIIKAIAMSKMDINIGQVQLIEKLDTLKEVVISHKANVIKVEPIKITYEISKDAAVRQLTAAQAMNYMPFMSADGAGNISFRGGEKFIVWIDGEEKGTLSFNPSLALKSIPVKQIKSIELLTDPPAKYLLDGYKAVLNIITMNQNLGGYTGDVTLSLDSRHNTYDEGYLFYQKGKLGLQFSYTLKTDDNKSDNMTITRNPQGGELLNQSTRTAFSNTLQYGTIDLDYQVNKTSRLSGYVSGNFQKNQNNIASDYNRLPTAGNYQFGQVNGFNATTNSMTEVGLAYDKKFKKVGERIKIATRVQFNDGRIRGLTGNSIGAIVDSIKNSNSTSTLDFGFKADYERPISEKIGLESGTKLFYRNYDSDYSKESYSFAQQSWSGKLNVPDLAFRQSVGGIYGALRYTDKKNSIRLFLSAELTADRADMYSTGTTIDRNYFNVLPKFSFYRTLNPKTTLGILYSIRLKRPGLQQLNPFVNDIDPNALLIGNPNLSTAIAHEFTVPLIWIFKNRRSLSLSVLYTFIHRDINLFTTVQPDGKSTTAYANIGTGNFIGASSQLSYPFAKSASFRTNITVYLTTYRSGQIALYQGISYISTSTLALNPDKSSFSTNLSLLLSKPQPNLQGTNPLNYQYDWFINKYFLKRKLTTFISLANIFTKEIKLNQRYNTGGIDRTVTTSIPSRNIRVGLTYNFGKLDSFAPAKIRVSSDDIK